jgi:hypothetical protein
MPRHYDTSHRRAGHGDADTEEVLAALARCMTSLRVVVHGGGRTELTGPTATDVARACGRYDAAVRPALARLVEAGVLRVEQRGCCRCYVPTSTQTPMQESA